MREFIFWFKFLNATAVVLSWAEASIYIIAMLGLTLISALPETLTVLESQQLCEVTTATNSKVKHKFLISIVNNYTEVQ